MTLPGPPFEHLGRLTDSVGLVEHASGADPLRVHGYCTDDVARALVVVLREPDPGEQLRRLEALYFTFLVRAALPDGRFHNRLSAAPECLFLDESGGDDTVGRAVWALGAAARRGTSPGLRRQALRRFERCAVFESPFPRANAAAALGAAEVLELDHDHRPARALAERLAERLRGPAGTDDWPWPEPRLAYENARITEAQIALGDALPDARLTENGLALLDWLVAIETNDGHFSFTPAAGWTAGEPRPAFDQQPIEAGAMADACARAYEVTGEARWADACVRAAGWFLGANDAAVPLYDPVTGGCRDGLGARGASANEGAESTLALVSALQQARRVQTARSAPRRDSASTVAAPT